MLCPDFLDRRNVPPWAGEVAEYLEEDETKTPYVGARTISGSADVGSRDFRSHVSRGASRLVALPELEFVLGVRDHTGGTSEVGKDCTSKGIDEHVAWFDVPMEDGKVAERGQRTNLHIRSDKGSREQSS